MTPYHIRYAVGTQPIVEMQRYLPHAPFSASSSSEIRPCRRTHHPCQATRPRTKTFVPIAAKCSQVWLSNADPPGLSEELEQENRPRRPHRCPPPLRVSLKRHSRQGLDSRCLLLKPIGAGEKRVAPPVSVDRMGPSCTRFFNSGYGHGHPSRHMNVQGLVPGFVGNH